MSGLSLMREQMIRSAVWTMSMAAAVVLALLVVLDWNPAYVAAGAAIGTLGFGVVEYRRQVRPRVPDGPLAAAPAGVAWEAPRRWTTTVWDLLIAIAAAGVMTWALGRDDAQLLASLAIGKFSGGAMANLAGLRGVLQWERRTGLRVALRRGEDEDGEERFAVHPLGLLGRR